MANQPPNGFIRPEQAVALDPVQFEFAIHYTDEGRHIPLRKAPPQGLALTDDDINRFGMSAARFFQGDFVKMSSFLWRHSALMSLLRSRVLDERFHRPQDRKGAAEWVHDAVIDVAAFLPLSSTCEFDAGEFVAKLEEKL